jgi:hypothetical protein
MHAKPISSLAVALALAGLAGGASALTQVSTDVTANTTWCDGTNTGPIILEKPIFVKNGATLTILPGCVVRGQPRTAAVTPGSTVGVPGSLIVTQSGMLVAEGEPLDPIIFTTAATDNDNNGVPDVSGAFKAKWDPGDTFFDDTPDTAPVAPLDKSGLAATVSLWGGLVILGNAPTNLGNGHGVGAGKGLIEGLTVPGFPAADATYGGTLAHDSSGSIRYVSVRHAGDEIGNSNELNGVSLGAVGDGTVFEFVEVYVNFDDGFEWFGGTVNGNHLVVVFAGDDTFDLDQGYTGINQFLFGIMPFFNENDGGSFGSASGDKGGEWDGDDFGAPIPSASVDCMPFSNPNMYNLTIIGTTPPAVRDFTPTSLASANRGIQMRHGFMGELLNSIVVNTGSAQGFDTENGSEGNCAGLAVETNNIPGGSVAVLASTFHDGAALPAPELAALANGNADPRTALSPESDNVVGGTFPGLEKEDTTFDPTGDAAGKLVPSLKSSKINPRPKLGIASAGVAGGVTSGPDPAATYRGAFDRTDPALWTNGWTVLGIAGLL